MADLFSRNHRSQIMASVRSSGNASTELRLASIFRKHQISGWRRKSRLFGRPDFVFLRLKVAVFVDGCFWHGCMKHGVIPTTNSVFWKAKIVRNQRRDRLVNRVLTSEGWTVVR